MRGSGAVVINSGGQYIKVAVRRFLFLWRQMFPFFVETSHCGISHPRSSLKMLYAHGRRHGVTSLRVLDVGGNSVTICGYLPNTLLYEPILQNYLHRNFRFSSFRRLFGPVWGTFMSDKPMIMIAFFRSVTPGRALRRFQNGENRWFLLALFVRKSSRFSAVRALLVCNGAVVRVQRRPRRIAVRAPLESREGFTAGQIRFLEKTADAMPFVSGCERGCWKMYK